MNEKQPPESPGLSRRAFVQGTALAGFAAFLAACTGTKASSAPSATAAASASEAAAASTGPSVAPDRRPDVHPDAAAHHRAAQVRQLARLHRPDDRRRRRRAASPPGRVVQDARGLQEEVQRQGRLRREDRRQPVVLRDDPAGPGRQPADRLGPDGPDRLDGRQDHHQGLGRAARSGQRPELRQEPARPTQGQVWDPTNDYHYPWQSGMTGIGVNTKTLAENNIADPDQARPTCGTSRPTR